MHEQLLLLKKIAEYFNNIHKTEIANIINEELQKEVEKNPDFSEPDYVKDDLPTIFFRHVTLKRRKSEASMRKSLANNTNNTSKKLQKTKKSVVNFAPESIISSPSTNENQENNNEFENNPIEHLEETTHSILAPIHTNRISENIVRKSQFLPDLGSTPNHNHPRTENSNNIEIKLENIVTNELNVNENYNYDNDDDNNSLIMYDPEENFHQTLYNSDYLDNANDYDISNIASDCEKFIRESQLDIKSENVSREQENLNENNNNAGNDDFVLQQSATSQQYNTYNLELEIRELEINQSPSFENNSEAINQSNFSQLQNNENHFEEPNQSEIMQQHNLADNTKAENQLQINQFPENFYDNEEILQQNETNQSDIDNYVENLYDNNPVFQSNKTNQSDVDNYIERSIDNDSLFKKSVDLQILDQENNFNSETPIENLPLQCGQIPIEIDINSDNDYTEDQDPGINRNLLEYNASQDLFATETQNCEIFKVTNEIAIQCDPEELLKQPTEFRIGNLCKTKQKTLSESYESSNRKKRKIDYVDLDVEEICVDVDETTANVPKRARACSVSSLESLPAEDPIPQPVKPKRKPTLKAAVIFKEDKKLDIKRRILLTDGWLLWPGSLLSGCLKHYDVESFLEVIDSDFDRERSWTRKEILNIYLENMANEKLVHKFYHSGKKLDLFVKLPMLPEDLLESLDIISETYIDNLWNKNLGPKNGRKLCAEGAPHVVKDLLNLELDFVNANETVIL